MPSDELSGLLRAIPSDCLAEVTIECAPGTLTPAAVELWPRLGINRVSLGVQSFADEELRAVGRRHNAGVVASDIALLRSAGLSNINVDLIAGLPNQTYRSWEESLEAVADLEPPHVSVYIFEVDEDSRLGKESLSGGVRYGAGLLPSDDAMSDFYKEAVRQLSALGIERYEISNFAKPGFESKHNLKYWRREPYIGFGVDAHSFDRQYRWGNPDTLTQYLGGVEPVRESVNAEEESFLVGLRLTSGFEPSAHERESFASPIRKWVDLGLLEENGRRLRLSDDGFLLSNEILQDFLHV
jgi:oxygen-independent coproporphyrinogen-3 oxidase